MGNFITRINIDIVCFLITCIILIVLFFYPAYFAESSLLRLLLVFGGGVAPLRYLRDLKRSGNLDRSD
ncbi:MAG: hypothetical protein CL595_13865 [Alteromonas sp.]|nr:hypothetical protein [Alteromonas sp.]HBF73125.1 hypothetical protein [Alteromonas australica]